MTDEELVKMFLLQYIELLRKSGRSDWQYRADTIEDLLRRIEYIA